MKTQTKVLCEAAILVAIGFVLSYFGISPVASGGSIDIAMLPIILFAVRHGTKWGTGAGFVYGILQYFEGHGVAIDWTTILADYVIAYTLLGFGAGLFKKRPYLATLSGGVLRFLAHYLAGAIVWGKWMPDEFLGLPMTSPFIYSLIYNGIYMLPCIVIVLVLFRLLCLNSQAKKFIFAEDLK